MALFTNAHPFFFEEIVKFSESLLKQNKIHKRHVHGTTVNVISEVYWWNYTQILFNIKGLDRLSTLFFIYIYFYFLKAFSSTTIRVCFKTIFWQKTWYNINRRIWLSRLWCQPSSLPTALHVECGLSLSNWMGSNFLEFHFQRKLK